MRLPLRPHRRLASAKRSPPWPVNILISTDVKSSSRPPSRKVSLCSQPSTFGFPIRIPARSSTPSVKKNVPVVAGLSRLCPSATRPGRTVEKTAEAGQIFGTLGTTGRGQKSKSLTERAEYKWHQPCPSLVSETTHSSSQALHEGRTLAFF